MKMIVELTNLTDSPDKDSTKVSIYNRSLKPGQSMKLDAALVDGKVRALEKSGLISIGAVPSWYGAYKQKKGTTLSLEEIKARLGAPRKNSTAIPPKKVSVTVSDNVEAKEGLVVKSIEPKKKRIRRKKAKTYTKEPTEEV